MRHTDALGRFTMITIHGRQQYKLTFISSYRAFTNKNSDNSVWKQQRAAFETQGILDADPRKLHNMHLADAMDGIRQDPKHQFILFMDVNEKLTQKQNPTEESIDWLYITLGLPIDLVSKHTTYKKTALVIWASPMVTVNINML